MFKGQLKFGCKYFGDGFGDALERDKILVYISSIAGMDGVVGRKCQCKVTHAILGQSLQSVSEHSDC